jgi:ParB family chromosome partitioning protein
MGKRKALGKGLSSLIPEVPRAGAPGVLQLDVGLIRPNPRQPRRSIDDSALKELAGSIRSHGLLQPVVVRRDGEGYCLIIGERRWRAAVEAGVRKIPAIVREAGETQRLEMALVENLQRQALNPLDEARAYQLLIDESGLGHEELARRVGKSRSYVSNLLRILNLDTFVREQIAAGRLSMGHARALAGLVDPDRQRQAARRVVEGSLSVRETEELVALLCRGEAGGGESAAGRQPRKRRQDPNVRAAEERLREALGTAVAIKGSPEKGRIVIEYVSAAELHRLFETLRRAARSAPPPPADPRAVVLPGARTVPPESTG